ncbi:hypothetical protein [Streptomyces avicenniae]|uniref:hypothetical protein n=1 Tax=Streptomyces avicenniae TaxID=500153 RepID=UPI00069C99F0|nr:hypothetical protein [Streptomyces avicenniae]
MNSADGLPPEDEAEVERVLEEALRTARFTAWSEPAEAERLRAALHAALPAVTAAADEEYQRYVALRRAHGRADGAGGAGTGTWAVVVTLVPVLAAVAGVVFLLLGYTLGLVDPEPEVAAGMRGVGWVFALVAAGGMLIAVSGLVVAAVRNGSATAIRASSSGGGAAEVARARGEWRRALVERGVAPVLLAARREDDGAAAVAHPPQESGPRMRFSSPDFSSPRFSSPTFHGPGGAAARGDGGGAAPEPRYLHPGFSSPDFTSPAEGGDDA